MDKSKAAAILGRAGGRSKSPAKVAATRANMAKINERRKAAKAAKDSRLTT